MIKSLIGFIIVTLLFTMYVIYNHRHNPTKEDVLKITKNWSQTVKEVYLVSNIDGEWLTIFRTNQTILLARLEQNWLGLWEIKDDFEDSSSLSSVLYPPKNDDAFTWSAGGPEQRAYYFGQIINPEIKEIEVETKRDVFEKALLINAEGSRFFYIKSEEKVILPVNIRGYAETGELIYTTYK